MKRIKIVSGLAIGLSLIDWSQLMYQDTSEQARKLAHSTPIQIPIEKNTVQITKDFYPELDAPYEVFLASSLVGNSNQVGKAHIIIKIAKIEVARDNSKIDVFKSDMLCSDHYPRCDMAHFKSVANRKHTVTIEFENTDSRLYSFSPKIEISIPQVYRTKGLFNNFIKILALRLLGITILLILMFGLAQEFIARIYKQIR